MTEPYLEILNLPQAAAYLGVSTKTFHRVLREGEIPGRKVGREWKFSRRALERWVGDSRSRDYLDATDRDSAEPRRGRSPGPLTRRAPVRQTSDLDAEED